MHGTESSLERVWHCGLQHTSDSNRDLAAARQRHSEAMARELEDARARARNSELELAKKEAGHGREVRDPNLQKLVIGLGCEGASVLSCAWVLDRMKVCPAAGCARGAAP